MFNFNCLIVGLKLKQLPLFFLLLCIFPFCRAQAGYLYFQIASTSNRSDQYSKDTIQINNLILSGKSVVLSSQDKSLNSGDQALKLAISGNLEKSNVKAYSLLGNTYWYLIDYERAYEYFSKAYEIATQIKDVHGSIKNTIDIRVCFDVVGEFNEALKYYKKGRVLAELNKDAEPIDSALSITTEAYAASNQYPEVLATIKRTAKMSNSKGDERLLVEQYQKSGDLYGVEKPAGPQPGERITDASKAEPVQTKSDVSLIPVLKLQLRRYVKKTTIFWGIFN